MGKAEDKIVWQNYYSSRVPSPGKPYIPDGTPIPLELHERLNRKLRKLTWVSECMPYLFIRYRWIILTLDILS